MVAEVKRITEVQLADMLKGFRLAVRTEDGGLVNGEVHVPDNVALHVFRSVGAPPREPHPTGPRLADADLCARCGDQFKAGQACDACRESDADPELAAMAAVVAALERLRPDECSRVLDWARRRFAVDVPF